MQLTPQGRFPDWSGSWAFEPGTVTDLWGLVVGLAVFGFTVWIAMRQIQVMNQQTAMMREQSEASTRMEAITKRQGEIAELQHQLMLEQLAKATRPGIYMTGVGYEESAGWQRYHLYVHNRGNKTLNDFRWAVMYPEEYEGRVILRLLDGQMNKLPLSVLPDDRLGEHLYFAMEGVSKLSVHPGTAEELGDVVMADSVRGSVHFKWSIRCADGVFPKPDGVGDVGFLYGDEVDGSPSGMPKES